jgi:hypothetical protein
MRYFRPARDNELQLDIDSARQLKQAKRMIAMLQDSAHVKIIRQHIRPSKKKSHWHVSIFVAKKLPVIERIALQAILGSDPIREMMNWGRVKNDDPYPILFIEKHPPGEPCNCKNTKCIPRCKHARALQSSKAEFRAHIIARTKQK